MAAGLTDKLVLEGSGSVIMLGGLLLLILGPLEALGGTGTWVLLPTRPHCTGSSCCSWKAWKR